jgi:hypothetical protein
MKTFDERMFFGLADFEKKRRYTPTGKTGLTALS